MVLGGRPFVVCRGQGKEEARKSTDLRAGLGSWLASPGTNVVPSLVDWVAAGHQCQLFLPALLVAVYTVPEPVRFHEAKPLAGFILVVREPFNVSFANDFPPTAEGVGVPLVVLHPLDEGDGDNLHEQSVVSASDVGGTAGANVVEPVL
jgi:hypothetical protein